MVFQGISLDKKQQQLVSILDKIKITTSKQRSNKITILTKIYRWLFKTKLSPGHSNNIYIHGGVGRGKTMIMKGFYEQLSISKLFIHYQDFMRMIHESIHSMKGDSMHDVLLQVTKSLAKKYKYICIDEFEINDIADAMIIGRVFEALLEYGVGIAITSNTAPNNLYKSGLQREQFLPFIDTINTQFIVFLLDNFHDYRLDTASSVECRVLHPLSKDVVSQMQDIKNQFTDNGHYRAKTLEVFGRHITFPFTYKSVLVINFDDLCCRNFASNDLIAIVKNFSVIIMENVPIIHSDETDIVIRFINFIDNVYFYKVLLFISLADAPDKIYSSGKRVAEFQRTISRLYEMNSSEYLDACHNSANNIP